MDIRTDRHKKLEHAVERHPKTAHPAVPQPVARPDTNVRLNPAEVKSKYDPNDRFSQASQATLSLSDPNPYAGTSLDHLAPPPVPVLVDRNATPGMKVNPNAELDTSTIDDLRKPPPQAQGFWAGLGHLIGID